MNGTAVEYYDSGVIKGTYSYKNNLVHGVGKDFFPSGRLAEEAVYQNGRLMDKNGQWFSGVSKLFYENGQPWYEINYKNGFLDGTFKEYDENGQVMIIATYKDNQLNGPSKEFYPNGRLKSEFVYEDGLLLSSREYGATGRIIFERFIIR
jgi:antitoxin component YwqK of YwqJK toxin-antitoxin module